MERLGLLVAGGIAIACPVMMGGAAASAVIGKWRSAG